MPVHLDNRKIGKHYCNLCLCLSVCLSVSLSIIIIVKCFLLLSSGFGSDVKIIIFFIITVVVKVVTIVLCVSYWQVD